VLSLDPAESEPGIKRVRSITHDIGAHEDLRQIRIKCPLLRGVHKLGTDAAAARRRIYNETHDLGALPRLCHDHAPFNLYPTEKARRRLLGHSQVIRWQS